MRKLALAECVEPRTKRGVLAAEFVPCTHSRSPEDGPKRAAEDGSAQGLPKPNRGAKQTKNA